MAKRVNYLNNKDMLKEIHKSKATFCSYVDPDYALYDIILPSVDKINVRTIAEAKRNRAKKMSTEAYEAGKAVNKKVKMSEYEVDYKTIDKNSLIFRHVFLYVSASATLCSFNSKRPPGFNLDLIRGKITFPIYASVI